MKSCRTRKYLVAMERGPANMVGERCDVQAYRGHFSPLGGGAAMSKRSTFLRRGDRISASWRYSSVSFTMILETIILPSGGSTFHDMCPYPEAQKLSLAAHISSHEVQHRSSGLTQTDCLVWIKTYFSSCKSTFQGRELARLERHRSMRFFMFFVPRMHPVR